MEETVSAAEANRKFSELLRGVREGRSYVVTAHGKPVARIVPVTAHDKAPSGALDVLFARLRAQPIQSIGRWTREELYEDQW